jgi:hypothetical protein
MVWGCRLSCAAEQWRQSVSTAVAAWIVGIPCLQCPASLGLVAACLDGQQRSAVSAQAPECMRCMKAAGQRCIIAPAAVHVFPLSATAG